MASVREAFERLAELVEQKMNENRSACEGQGLEFQREAPHPRVYVVHVDENSLVSIICNDRPPLNDIGMTLGDGRELRIKPAGDRLSVQYPGNARCYTKDYDKVVQEFLDTLLRRPAPWD